MPGAGRSQAAHIYPEPSGWDAGGPSSEEDGTWGEVAA